MGIWRYLFAKKNQAILADEENIMATTLAILTKSETILNRIFNDHKMELLGKDPGYVIYSVFGMNEKGPLTEEQAVIHGKIDPVISSMIDMLEIEHLAANRKMAILFIVRMMMVHKLLFMMELFKNTTNQQSTHKQNRQQTLEEMDTLGHA
jgi:hypothetical protein